MGLTSASSPPTPKKTPQLPHASSEPSVFHFGVFSLCSLFRPSAAVCRYGLVESCTCHCGPPHLGGPLVSQPGGQLCVCRGGQPARGSAVCVGGEASQGGLAWQYIVTWWTVGGARPLRWQSVLVCGVRPVSLARLVEASARSETTKDFWDENRVGKTSVYTLSASQMSFLRDLYWRFPNRFSLCDRFWCAKEKQRTQDQILIVNTPSKKLTSVFHDSKAYFADVGRPSVQTFHRSRQVWTKDQMKFPRNI